MSGEWMMRSSIAIGWRLWKLRPGARIWWSPNARNAPPVGDHSLRSPISTVGQDGAQPATCANIVRTCCRRRMPEISRCIPTTRSRRPAMVRSARIAPRGSSIGNGTIAASSTCTLLRTSNALPCQPMLSGRVSSGTARYTPWSSIIWRGRQLLRLPNRRSASCSATTSASISCSTDRMRSGSRRRSSPTALWIL